MSRNYKYIVVEDEDLIRNNIVKKIESLNLPLEYINYADNGREALELTEKFNPDIIFTDIMMPIMDGLELAEEIYIAYPQIKIIIITGYGDFSLAQKAIRYGVVDYILKPINTEDLSVVLSRVITILQKEEASKTKDIPDNYKNMNYTKEQTMELVEEFIRDNYRKEITLGNVAEKIGFTPDYLSKLFKKYKQESPVKYISRLRIEEAKRLLIEEPNFEIKRIGELVGYFDQYYFSRTFKAQVGVYPTEFRKKYIP